MNVDLLTRVLEDAVRKAGNELVEVVSFTPSITAGRRYVGVKVKDTDGTTKIEYLIQIDTA